jgi:hypothetical protein
MVSSCQPTSGRAVCPFFQDGPRRSESQLPHVYEQRNIRLADTQLWRPLGRRVRRSAEAARRRDHVRDADKVKGAKNTITGPGLRSCKVA